MKKFLRFSHEVKTFNSMDKLITIKKVLNFFVGCPRFFHEVN